MKPLQLVGDDFENKIIAAHNHQSQIWTAIPGIIQSFDPLHMTCTVQPAIQAKVFGADNSVSDVSLPLLVDCPVQFPAGGGCALTFPVAKYDECLVVFSSRCIDAWWQSGGIQAQAEMRMHDLSDGFVLLGFRSVPRVIPSISLTAVQLRSDDGLAYVEVTSSGHIANIVAPGGVNINGVHFDSSGNMSNVGTLHANGEGTFNSHTVGGHTHPDPQGGNVALPTG